jgi:hypothetical protein
MSHKVHLKVIVQIASTESFQDGNNCKICVHSEIENFSKENYIAFSERLLLFI